MAQGKTFPNSVEQGQQFLLQLIKIIHTDDELVNILQQKTGGSAPTSTIVGAMAAKILTLLFSNLAQQTGGAKVAQKYVIEIIRVAVKEISDIADVLGLDTTVKDEQLAAKIAGDALDQSMKQLYSGGGQQRQQPQQQPQQQQRPQGMMAQVEGGM